MNKIFEEIQHGKKILKNAELLWGWRSPAGKKRADRRAKLLIRFGEINAGSKVLEIGCGTGVFTEKLARTGAKIIAIDISQDLISKARQGINYSNVVFSVTNIENMNFKNESFDVVVGVSVLHHLNLIPAVKEINRVLKVNGKIVFTEPNMLNPQIMVQKNCKLVGKLLGDTMSETAFFKWQLRNIFQKNGFREIVIEPLDFLHPWVPSYLVNLVEKIGLFFEKIPIIREFAGSLVIYGKKA